MYNGLQVGFGSWIGEDLLRDLRDRGVQMIRCDMQQVVCASDLDNLLSEIWNLGLKPLAVIDPEQVEWLPRHAALDIEILNEPDLSNMDPIHYADEILRVTSWLARPDYAPVTVWAGVISNLDIDSLEWLRRSLVRWPFGVNVSVHRYPPNGGTPDTPHRWAKSREQEVEALKAIIGKRNWGVSEFGYHTGEQSTGHWPFKKRWNWTDDEVAGFTAQEVEFWRNQGAEFCCCYQINDGPTEHYLDNFGWRTVDGAWKPVANTFQTVTV